VGSIPANSDAQNVPSFRRWRHSSWRYGCLSGAQVRPGTCFFFGVGVSKFGVGNFEGVSVVSLVRGLELVGKGGDAGDVRAQGITVESGGAAEVAATPPSPSSVGCM
jgi:hypothetical protein